METGSSSRVIDGRLALRLTRRMPLMNYLCGHFERVGAIALREKLFPEISEDVWLLYCDGFGGCTNLIEWSVVMSACFLACKSPNLTEESH